MEVFLWLVILLAFLCQMICMYVCACMHIHTYTHTCVSAGVCASITENSSIALSGCGYHGGCGQGLLYMCSDGGSD